MSKLALFVRLEAKSGQEVALGRCVDGQCGGVAQYPAEHRESRSAGGKVAWLTEPGDKAYRRSSAIRYSTSARAAGFGRRPGVNIPWASTSPIVQSGSN
jgi:hypothetical protein